MALSRLALTMASVALSISACAQTNQKSQQSVDTAAQVQNASGRALTKTSPAVARQATGKTRAEVREELIAAKAAGLVGHGELDYPPTSSAANLPAVR